MLKGENFRVNLAIFAYVVVMTMLCATSSPLLNGGGIDTYVFRVMGRALVEGRIMYKDVFDHKGLYLYFINALGVILNEKSFTGLFAVECVFMFLCARTVYALLSFYSDRKSSFIGMQIFMLFLCLKGIFVASNYTEEYALTFQVLAVYLLAKDGGKLSCLHMFMQGVLVGIVICIRPNIAMMWGGIAIVAGYELLRQKKFSLLAGNIAAGILGVMAGVMPAVIYAVRNDAVSDMIFGMFGYNLMYVGASEVGNFASTMAGRLLGLLKVSGEMHVISKTIALIFAMLVTSCVIVRKSRLNAYYFAMLAMTILSVAMSGRNYGHYYISLVPFCLPFACWTATRIRHEMRKYAVIAVFILSALLDFKTPYLVRELLGRNVFTLDEFVKANEPYQSANERVLVTGNMAVLYDKLKVVPQEKYFYIPANPYDLFPDPIDSQTASILSGVNDVIIVAKSEVDGKIFPETGRSSEIQSFLDRNYNVLHTGSDANSSFTMYGRKR